MMSRLARLVLPGIAYHVTQRGNRRGQTFFEDGDYALYRDLLSEAAQKAEAQVWCYCPAGFTNPCSVGCFSDYTVFW